MSRPRPSTITSPRSCPSSAPPRAARPPALPRRSGWWLKIGNPRLQNGELLPMRGEAGLTYLSRAFKETVVMYVGSCFCGAVTLEVSGEPEAMGYCHCRSCRSWSGGPVNAFSLWKPDAVKVTAGKANVAVFKKTDRKSTRLNSSHVEISYAVFCLKKKKIQ